MDDLISRQEAIEVVETKIKKWNAVDGEGYHVGLGLRYTDVIDTLTELPSAQPTEASCWGCNCQKMERLNEQKTFSEMVHLHDAETHEERTETHACDLISRQAAIDAILAVTGNSSVRELYEHVQEHGLSDMWSGGVNAAIDIIIAVPPAQPDMSEYSDKLWKAAYERGKAEAQQRWIPCSERLPDEEALCCDTRGEMIIGYPYPDEESNTGFSAEFDDVFMIDCAAWMPLPKPYRAERRTDVDANT